MKLAAVLLLAGACGGSDLPTEVVVSDARLGGASPVVIGATADSVTWSAAPGDGTTLLAASSLASLPAMAQQLATAAGPVAHTGDSVLFAGADHWISRVGIDMAMQHVTKADPDAIGEAADSAIIAWSLGPVVSWGVDGTQGSATIIKIDSCDQVRVTAASVYVAGDSATGRRLVRIDQRTSAIDSITASTSWAAMFPGGAVDGATYAGRIAAADDAGALWLVEEKPSGRGILISAPLQGEPSVVLEHVQSAKSFFASADTVYWQEGSELLRAPRAGGAASIVTSLPGPAGAFADGYVYFTDGAAIKRVSVE